MPISLFEDVSKLDEADVVVRSVGHNAAYESVMRYHYSQAMPAASHYYGCWESDKFIGAILYGGGANRFLGEPYGLDHTEVCELVRVALTDHVVTVSRCVSLSIKELKLDNPKLRLIVSFADPEHGHHGGIYQAGNWIYNGMSGAADEYIVKGERMHGRSLRAVRQSQRRPGDEETKNVLEWAQKYLDPDVEQIIGSSKHRYLYPLDKAMRRQINKLALPYPPRGLSVDGDTSSFPDGDDGSTPSDRS